MPLYHEANNVIFSVNSPAILKKTAILANTENGLFPTWVYPAKTGKSNQLANTVWAEPSLQGFRFKLSIIDPPLLFHFNCQAETYSQGAVIA